MRNRPTYHAAPAQGEMLFNQPTPRRATPTIHTDKLLLILFFILVPFLWVLSWIWHGFLWILFFTILSSIALLLLRKGFTPRGRLTMTALYTLFAVLALTNLLGGGTAGAPATTPTRTITTIPPLTATSLPTLPTPAPADDSGTGLLGTEGNQASGVNAGGQQRIVTACEQTLIQYLEGWKTGIAENMLQQAAPSWRAKQSVNERAALQYLYWQSNGKKLISYAIIGEPTGTENDTARNIALEAVVEVSSENSAHRTLQFNALLLRENEQWYVDPNSLSSGVPVAEANLGNTGGDAPVQNEATAKPSPSPTPAPSKNLKLYYNSSGGKYYHKDASCSTVAKEYLPLKSNFKYSAINDSKYNKLLPCDKCDAPRRP